MTIPFKVLRERRQADPTYREAHADILPEMDLAFAMVEARHRSSLSQTEVAERVGTSQAMVARWETGRSAPTTSLRRFADATGTRLRNVFETDDVT